MRSLSARRAWIEILFFFALSCVCYVALRKESVDRNVIGDVMGKALAVALRKESVDRNKGYRPARTNKERRSPQGERG